MDRPFTNDVARHKQKRSCYKYVALYIKTMKQGTKPLTQCTGTETVIFVTFSYNRFIQSA